MSGLLSLPDEFFGHSARLAGVPRYQGVAGNVSTICNGHCYWMARCTLFFFKGAVMNIRQSRLLKLVISGVLALSALWGTGSALAYAGTWTPAAIEGGWFSVNPGDFVRYGRTDVDGCQKGDISGCPGLWSYKGFASAGYVQCSNQTWGGDPYPNKPKNCEKLADNPLSSGSGLNFVVVESNANLKNIIDANANWGSTCANGASCIYYIGFSSNGAAAMISTSLTPTRVCTNASMGTDPSPGVQKNCFVAKP